MYIYIYIYTDICPPFSPQNTNIRGGTAPPTCSRPIRTRQEATLSPILLPYIIHMYALPFVSSEYQYSWWHRTSNLLKADTHAPGTPGGYPLSDAIAETFTSVATLPTAFSEWWWGPTAAQLDTTPAGATSTAI